MRTGQARPIVERPRVLALATGAPVVLLEAPGGYGKTTTVRQLAAALDRPLVRAVVPEAAEPGALLSALAAAARRAGQPALAEAIDTDDPEATLERLLARLEAIEGMVLAVDEVQRAGTEAGRWLARLAARAPSQVRVALAGRRLGSALHALVDEAEATLLRADDLRMDRDEVGSVVAAGRRSGDLYADEAGAVTNAILAATEGWPAAVVLAASLGDSGGTVPGPGSGTDPAGPRRVLRRLLEDLLAAAAPEDRATIAHLAPLPLLSSRVAALVGGAGALERLLDLGLPLRFRTDGWAELPDPVRDLLPAATPAPEMLRAVAAHYAERDALLDGVALLRRTGDLEGLGGLLGGLTREAIGGLGPLTIAAVAADLPDPILAAAPAFLVHLVQAVDRRPRVRAEWLERSLRLLPDPSPERRAVQAEQALDLGRAGELDAGRELASAVIEAADPGETRTLGRARYVRGLLRLVADPAGGAAAAAEEIDAAIALLQAAGERGWEATAWEALGNGCHTVAGRLDAGVACIQRAVALRPAQDVARAVTLTYLAELQVHRGDLDAAAVAVREAETIGRRLGDPRSIAFAAWSGARLAAERRDAAGVHAALATAEANPEGWFDQLAGIDFLADGADMLAIVGDAVGARRWIARTEERGREVGREEAPLLARARLAVAEGAADAALGLLERLEESFLAAPRDRWLAWLLRAAALALLGRGDEARGWVARARLAVADQGDPRRVERREPELLARAEGAAGAGPAAAPAGDVVIVLLGRFAVERGGVDVSPPPGRPATLLKLVALRGLVTLDEAVEALWEDADEEVGRARLRNVLNRVRGACGEVLVRREEAIALAPGVIVDASRFEEEAAGALRAGVADRVGRARAALTRATGELLPGDRYADWASAPRERITRRHLALLDLVADDAIARGDLDEAARLLDEAIALDPLEEERHVRLGRALLRQGRTAAARRVADRATALCEELDVAPGEDLARLIRDVARQG